MIYQEMKQNIGNPYQMEDNKAPPSAAPQVGARLVCAHLDVLFGISDCFSSFFACRHAVFFGRAHQGTTVRGTTHFSVVPSLVVPLWVP